MKRLIATVVLLLASSALALAHGERQLFNRGADTRSELLVKIEVGGHGFVDFIALPENAALIPAFCARCQWQCGIRAIHAR